MSNYEPLQETEISPIFEFGGEDYALRLLSEVSDILSRDALTSSISQVSFDEQRNKAIFQLNGEIVSQHADDQSNVPFPWMNEVLTTEIEHINATKNQVDAVVNYYLGNLDTPVSSTSVSDTLED